MRKNFWLSEEQFTAQGRLGRQLLSTECWTSPPLPLPKFCSPSKKTPFFFQSTTVRSCLSTCTIVLFSLINYSRNGVQSLLRGLYPLNWTKYCPPFMKPNSVTVFIKDHQWIFMDQIILFDIHRLWIYQIYVIIIMLVSMLILSFCLC